MQGIVLNNPDWKLPTIRLEAGKTGASDHERWA